MKQFLRMGFSENEIMQIKNKNLTKQEMKLFLEKYKFEVPDARPQNRLQKIVSDKMKITMLEQQEEINNQYEHHKRKSSRNVMKKRSPVIASFGQEPPFSPISQEVQDILYGKDSALEAGIKSKASYNYKKRNQKTPLIQPTKIVDYQDPLDRVHSNSVLVPDSRGQHPVK